MTLETQLVGVLQVLLAILLSTIIGLDRERRHRPAGLRTHILVGLGACLFTVISVNAFEASDRSRIAANIVVGVGFLGGGVIVHTRDRLPAVTTAATIWVTAAIGLGVGAGAWFLSICSTLFIWVVLVVIARFEKHDNLPGSQWGGINLYQPKFAAQIIRQGLARGWEPSENTALVIDDGIQLLAEIGYQLEWVQIQRLLPLAMVAFAGDQTMWLRHIAAHRRVLVIDAWPAARAAVTRRCGAS
jgi:putative Mg2+ transporter-C (MgtC) family protein